MKYLVVYERSSNGWGAYAPDLPGLGVAGRTIKEAKDLIREAIEFHLEAVRERGEAIPKPSATTEFITVQIRKVRQFVAAVVNWIVLPRSTTYSSTPSCPILSTQTKSRSTRPSHQ
ncbi:MAG: type II toxin-antitoxin system HicB family antitoxin [Terriglobales bacterium]